MSSGPIPFDPQPSQVHFPFESSSSAAMLQKPPTVSHPVTIAQGALAQQSGDITQPSQDLREVPAELLASPGRKGAHETGFDSASAHQHEPEHEDGPMEEIQLHTDTESASNEPQEEPPHYPNTARQSPYPSSKESHHPEPTVDNGAPSLEQSTQAASAAVAEAIAAANRAAGESSGGALLTRLRSHNLIAAPAVPHGRIGGNTLPAQYWGSSGPHSGPFALTLALASMATHMASREQANMPGAQQQAKPA